MERKTMAAMAVASLVACSAVSSVGAGAATYCYKGAFWKVSERLASNDCEKKGFVSKRNEGYLEFAMTVNGAQARLVAETIGGKVRYYLRTDRGLADDVELMFTDKKGKAFDPYSKVKKGRVFRIAFVNAKGAASKRVGGKIHVRPDKAKYKGSGVMVLPLPTNPLVVGGYMPNQTVTYKAKSSGWLKVTVTNGRLDGVSRGGKFLGADERTTKGGTTKAWYKVKKGTYEIRTHASEAYVKVKFSKN